jgi:hypothetical protein
MTFNAPIYEMTIAWSVCCYYVNYYFIARKEIIYSLLYCLLERDKFFEFQKKKKKICLGVKISLRSLVRLLQKGLIIFSFSEEINYSVKSENEK